jgi:hypothetical protein
MMGRRHSQFKRFLLDTTALPKGRRQRKLPSNSILVARREYRASSDSRRTARNPVLSWARNEGEEKYHLSPWKRGIRTGNRNCRGPRDQVHHSQEPVKKNT